MASHTEKVIPLTVVGGFLGSGKTTLINRIIHSDRSGRTVVLVNDFGSINIDEQLIAAAGGQTIALTNGCVCCSIGDDLTDALIRASELCPIPDWIVIEASGVADPREIAKVGVVDPILIIDGVIVVVDAAEIRKYVEDSRLTDTVLRQLRAADILLLNKTDLVSAEVLDDVHRWLETIAPAATIHAATDADIPWELLRSPNASSSGSVLEAPTFQVDSFSITSAKNSHHDRLFGTWTYETTRVLKKDMVRRLLDSMPPEVLRAKGLVRLDADPAKEIIVQFAGQSRTLKASGQQARETSRIVFIGISDGTDFASVRGMLSAAEI